MSRKFQLIPAIDLMDGQCVRLTQGLADQKRVYSDNPPEMARSFEMSGAKRLHVVDLDGAFKGEPVNMDSIRAIRERVKMKIEVGGGLRTMAALEAIFEIGVDYAILGTQAVEDPKFLKESLRLFGDKIIVGVDASDGKVATKGWIEVRDLDALDWAKELESIGVQTIIYTDIAVDGALTGPNLPAQRQMAESVTMSVIASGGIASIDDVMALPEITCDNLIGAIAGKAIYDGRLNLSEALNRLAAR